jgi:hypothetical protein
MISTYDLYGIVAPSLEHARSIVEQGLGISMRLHESSMCGDYYRKGMTGTEHFILQQNYDPVENEWAEPEYRTANFLLYINETNRAAALRGLLSGLAHVTHLRTRRV